MLEQGSWIKSHAIAWVEDLVLRLWVWGIDALNYLIRTPRPQLPSEQRSTVQADLHDLSETVQQSEPHCFTASEYADLWKGRPTPSIASRNLEGPLAIKVIRGIVLDEGQKQDLTKRLLQTIKTSSALRSGSGRHPNIVPVFGFVTNRGSFPSPVTPYYANGDALHYVSKEANADKHQIILDIANALKFMHTLDPPVVHGNLRASNVLIDDYGRALISDIGVYIVVCEPQYGFSVANIAGASRWTAPEVLDPPGLEECTSASLPLSGLVTRESDVYAFGMTVLEIYTGQKPFSNLKHEPTVLSHVINGIRPKRPGSSKVTDNLWNLICDCSMMDPGRRPSMIQIHDRLISSTWASGAPQE